MNTEELRASGLILDLGVPIPIRPLGFFNSKRKHVSNPAGGHRTAPAGRTVTVRRPCLGGLIRMSRQFLELDVRHEEMKDWSTEQNLSFIAGKGKKVSLLVAGAIARGYYSYRLFGRIVAWWLRWRVHPLFLAEAMYQLIDNADIHPFLNIIKSTEAAQMLQPRLSH